MDESFEFEMDMRDFNLLAKWIDGCTGNAKFAIHVGSNAGETWLSCNRTLYLHIPVQNVKLDGDPAIMKPGDIRTMQVMSDGSLQDPRKE